MIVWLLLSYTTISSFYQKLQSIYLFASRYLTYDPTVPPVDETSKKIFSEKYVELLKYMESVGFTKEVITFNID